MISRSSRLSPAGALVRRTRCTRRSLEVTVPSDSKAPAAAGSTTSAIAAVAGEHHVLHHQHVEAARAAATVRCWSASDCAGFSPIT